MRCAIGQCHSADPSVALQNFPNAIEVLQYRRLSDFVVESPWFPLLILRPLFPAFVFRVEDSSKFIAISKDCPERSVPTCETISVLEVVMYGLDCRFFGTDEGATD